MDTGMRLEELSDKVITVIIAFSRNESATTQ